MAYWNGNTLSVGDLYTSPKPESIETNPNIGLEQRNEIELPRKYKDFAIKNLSVVNINGNPYADVSLWSLYPAIHNVVANLVNGVRTYNISGFENVSATSFSALGTGGSAGIQGTISAATSVSSPVVNCNLFCNVGDSLLYEGLLTVKGGTQLDGGELRGTTISCLPTESGLNAIRFEVLPTGIFATTALPLPIEITSAATVGITSLGATTITAGGVTSISAGSRIELDTGELRCKNSLATPDNTDLYIGNIHPAIGGSRELQLNAGGTGRGIEITDGTLFDTQRINTSRCFIPSAVFADTWNSFTLFSVGTIVSWNGLEYIQTNYATLGLQPGAPIPVWYSAGEYDVGAVVLETEGAVISYRCISYVSSETPPSEDPTHWVSDESGGLTTFYWPVAPTIPNRDSIIFSPVEADTYYYSFFKPSTLSGIWIAKRNATTNALVDAGRILTSTITDDLNMNGYNIINVAGLSGPNPPNRININSDLTGNSLRSLFEFNYYEVIANAIGNATIRFKCADTTTALELSNSGENDPAMTMFAPTSLTISSPDLVLNSTGTIHINNTTDFGIHDITGIDNAFVYAIRMSVPDTPNFNYFRWYGNYVSYSTDNVVWRAIAQDWYNFSPEADVYFDLKNLYSVNSLQVSNITNESPITIGTTVDFTGNTLGGVGDLYVSTINGNTSDISVKAGLDMFNNSVRNVSTLSTDSITSVSTDDISFSTKNLTNVSRMNGQALFQYCEFVNASNITLTTNTPTRLPFTTSTITPVGFSLNGDGDVVCNVAGTYRIMLLTNVSKTGGGTSQVNVWFRINGTDVSFSDQQHSITNANARDSVVNTRIFTFAVNDVLTCIFASSDNAVIAQAVASQTTPYAHPSSPSVCINLVCV